MTRPPLPPGAHDPRDGSGHFHSGPSGPGSQGGGAVPSGRHPQGGFPMRPPGTPKRRSRGGLVVGVLVVACVLLAGGSITVAVLAGKRATGGTPSTPAPGPPGPPVTTQVTTGTAAPGGQETAQRAVDALVQAYDNADTAAFDDLVCLSAPGARRAQPLPPGYVLQLTGGVREVGDQASVTGTIVDTADTADTKSGLLYFAREGGKWCYKGGSR